MAEFTATLHSTLQNYQLPGGSSAYFAKVFKGEPNALTVTNRALCRWRVLRSEVPPEGPRVLTGDRMIAVVFGVSCYWPLAGAETATEAIEDDIADVIVTLPISIIAIGRGDTIGGKTVREVTVEDPSTVERVAPFPQSDVEMRVLEFEVHARILEAA